MRKVRQLRLINLSGPGIRRKPTCSLAQSLSRSTTAIRIRRADRAFAVFGKVGI